MDDPIILVNIYTSVIGKLPQIEVKKIEKGNSKVKEEAILAQKNVYFSEENILVPVLDRKKLLAGNKILEPAIILQSDSTSIIYPGWEALVLENGNLLLKKK